MPLVNTRVATPEAAIQPQTSTDPPPCFTVPIIFFGSSSEFTLCHTFARPFDPCMLNLLSSEKITLLYLVFTLFQKPLLAASYYFANESLFLRLTALINRFLRMLRPW